MKNSLETRLGVFFALVVIAAFVLVEMIGGASFFHRGKEVRAYFESVRELKVGDPVKLAGVTVGRVSDIRLATNKVEVAMRLDRGRAGGRDRRGAHGEGAGQIGRASCRERY